MKKQDSEIIIEILSDTTAVPNVLLENFREFNEVMLQMPEVVECCVVSGTFDYLIKIVAADVESYHAFYQEKLASLRAISHISSFFVMSEVKSTTALPI